MIFDKHANLNISMEIDISGAEDIMWILLLFKYPIKLDTLKYSGIVTSI